VDGRPGGCRTSDAGALPNLVVIGAMKCGTTSLHSYLDRHPDIAMSRPKELNFFFGPADTDSARTAGQVDWSRGNWHCGPAWYADQFDATAAVRGEASPGYTSPSYPEVAARMAAVIPGARLVYAVRDPIARAVSQFLHHRRDGTETRPVDEALLDPGSQYIARGRYLERLAPFLATGAFEGRITVVAQEQLGSDLAGTLQRLAEDLRVDGDAWAADPGDRHNESEEPPPQLERRLVRRLREAFQDDADRLRELTGQEFPGWSV
jgi:hypothetical protein